MIIQLKKIKLFFAILGYVLLRAAFLAVVIICFGWTVAVALRT